MAILTIGSVSQNNERSSSNLDCVLSFGIDYIKFVDIRLFLSSNHSVAFNVCQVFVCRHVHFGASEILLHILSIHLVWCIAVQSVLEAYI